jgi:hypothetical protein
VEYVVKSSKVHQDKVVKTKNAKHPAQSLLQVEYVVKSKKVQIVVKKAPARVKKNHNRPKLFSTIGWGSFVLLLLLVYLRFIKL